MNDLNAMRTLSACSLLQISSYDPTAAHSYQQSPHAAFTVPLALERDFRPKDSHWQSPTMILSPFSWSLTASTKSGALTMKGDKTARIGIIGGGIAGVSVARALTQRLPSDMNYKIVVFEGDNNGGASNQLKNESPRWMAATARNANSLVPGAAMHVFSRASVVGDIIAATISAWWLLQKEALTPRRMFQDEPVHPEAFSLKPPYFALNVFRCIGPTATQEERLSFFRFVSNFLYTIIWLGDSAADMRGRQLCDLAKANRKMYLKEFEKHTALQKADSGHSRGFLNIYRKLKEAKGVLQEARDHGEPAELLDWKQAIEFEPRLKNLPIEPLFAVWKPNDYSSSCEAFIRRWIGETTKCGVRYDFRKVTNVTQSEVAVSKAEKGYLITTEDGSETEVDVLVLAAGIQTPLFAAQLGAGNYCPTYPLRGFSLTIFAPTRDENKENRNLLHYPFSVDSMYCSSVSPVMARFAGFGELVGYRDKAHTVRSVGPSFLARYARTVFPDASNVTTNEALPCFRPLSPDDLPLVGEVETKPNLYLHTGHGTLGWTVGLATGDCVAQAIVDKLQRKPHDDFFSFPDDIRIKRSSVSPSRFL